MLAKGPPHIWPSLYYYVEDFIVIVRLREQTDEFWGFLNSLHIDIKYTAEFQVFDKPTILNLIID